MADDKPLNVRVAEALGWTGTLSADPCPWWEGYHPTAMNAPIKVSPYGDDTPAGWACTGPLIPRYRLSLVAAEDGYFCSDAELEREVEAPTPCAAVAEWCAKFAEEKA